MSINERHRQTYNDEIQQKTQFGSTLISSDQLLQEGLCILGLNASCYQPIFLEYLNLLQKWNRVYNLTAIRDANDIVLKHFFDSLVIHPYLSGHRIIDVGSGAGFPGVPLAIIDSTRQFVLLDSQIKKIQFLTMVKNTLDLKHVEIVHARAEDFLPEVLFDTVLTRAFSTLDIMKEKTQHLLNKGGQFLAMKGQYPTEELKALGDNSHWEVYPLKVPYLHEERHLVRGR